MGIEATAAISDSPRWFELALSDVPKRIIQVQASPTGSWVQSFCIDSEETNLTAVVQRAQAQARWVGVSDAPSDTMVNGQWDSASAFVDRIDALTRRIKLGLPHPREHQLREMSEKVDASQRAEVRTPAQWAADLTNELFKR